MLRSSQSETRELGGLYVEHIRKELELCFISSQMDCIDGTSRSCLRLENKQFET